MAKIPSLLIFREVLEGDLLKFQNKSNTSDTGGGARDLRLRITKHPEMKEFLDEMFTSATSNNKVRKGKVHWEKNKMEASTDLEYWQPTNARPGELRLANISRVLGWEISPEEFRNERAAGNYLFFLLVLDTDSNIWARIFNSKYLNGADIDVRFKHKIEEVLSSNYTGTKQGATRFNL